MSVELLTDAAPSVSGREMCGQGRAARRRRRLLQHLLGRVARCVHTQPLLTWAEIMFFLLCLLLFPRRPSAGCAAGLWALLPPPVRALQSRKEMAGSATCIIRLCCSTVFVCYRCAHHVWVPGLPRLQAGDEAHSARSGLPLTLLLVGIFHHLVKPVFSLFELQA